MVFLKNNFSRHGVLLPCSQRHNQWNFQKILRRYILLIFPFCNQPRTLHRPCNMVFLPAVFTVSVFICNICHFQFNHSMFSDQPFSQNESSINKTCVAVMNCKTLHFNNPIRSLAFVIQPTMSETPSIFKILYFSREFKKKE